MVFSFILKKVFTTNPDNLKAKAISAG